MEEMWPYEILVTRAPLLFPVDGQVRQFYTSPTLIRALEAHGEKWVQQHDLSSLRVLGTVG